MKTWLTLTKLAQLTDGHTTTYHYTNPTERPQL